jgi:hypothetical protein
MNIRALGMAAGCLVISGCKASVIEEGETTRIAFDQTTRVWLIGVPLALVLAGGVLAIFRSTRVAGLVSAALIALLAVLIVPGVLMDEVTITPDSIYQRTGFWFSPTVKGFEFAEVKRVVITDKIVRDHKQEIWELQLTNGVIRDLDPGDLWEHNTPAILSKLGTRVLFERRTEF